MYVYAVTDASGLIKIGLSRRGLGQRIDNLKRLHRGLRFIGAERAPNSRLREAELHRHFASQRVCGEWFSITEDELLDVFSPNMEIMSVKQARALA